eukprot:gene12154-16274_t
MEEIVKNIEVVGSKIRELKAAKANKELIAVEVASLLQLKESYKKLSGKEYSPPTTSSSSLATSIPIEKTISKTDKSNENKSNKKSKENEVPQKETSKATTAIVNSVIDIIKTEDLIFYSSDNKDDNLKCFIIAEYFSQKIVLNKDVNQDQLNLFPSLPALVKNELLIFGSNYICRYLAATSTNSNAFNKVTLSVESILDIEEFDLLPLLSSFQNSSANDSTVDQLAQIIQTLENEKNLSDHPLALYAIAISLQKSLTILSSHAKTSTIKYPYLSSLVEEVIKSPYYTTAVQLAEGKTLSKADKKKMKAASSSGNDKNNQSFSTEDIVKPNLDNIDWETTGLISALSIIFTSAIEAAFINHKSLIAESDLTAVISRCSNEAFGDFQCNNAMSLSKVLKGLPNYKGAVSPKDIADRICAAIPINPVIISTSSVPNGFINIKISPATLTNTISNIIMTGVLPPFIPAKRVLVDFSSPNIAKEMHVGHLRSTIIGDSICRVLEFCKFDVMRVNHVGDWGTQFGMLITYLLEAFPDILTSPPNISDLTVIYKASKARFDTDEQFKETSRLNVVKLQSGDKTCREIWTLLCNISRAEFQNVYNLLKVTLKETGESFYNPMIPSAIDLLSKKGLVYEESGMSLIKLNSPTFTIPLILKKSDGGYGYDSTDMAALHYRTHELLREWIVIITDAGQAPHFHMCFEAAKAAGWVDNIRLDHIGFGVVCGEDGKRFKTRASETVRLIDLLIAAKDKMKESLLGRVSENKSSLTPEEIEIASSIIGFGAVKYFDLKNHPSTNYIFKYERMLDTKGDTAVYLLFAYARINSILRKAKEERNIDIENKYNPTNHSIIINHPAERALAFELVQFGDVIKVIIRDLLPNRLCEYLHEVAVKMTDFVTKCHVLNAESEQVLISRLVMCLATKRMMVKCFELLGMDALEKI